MSFKHLPDRCPKCNCEVCKCERIAQRHLRKIWDAVMAKDSVAGGIIRAYSPTRN